MEKFRNKYRIGSARAKWHDYNGGIYFITICTKYRMHYFGEIVQTGRVESGHAPILRAPFVQFPQNNASDIWCKS